MTDLIVENTDSLSGTVKAPPSKAYTHRAIIAASLSERLSRVDDALICDDTLATIEALRMMGAKIDNVNGGILKIYGKSKPVTPKDVINCRDSGSTMRFLAPICALADGITVLTGGESLLRRPMGPLLEALKQIGVQCYSTRMDGFPPIVIFGGGIKGGKASIRGDVSSQFISGLLFAVPLAQSETDIVLSTPLESKPYVTITLDVLRRHGIKIDADPDYGWFHVPCGQIYTPFNHIIEGDYSAAAFILAAAAITGSHLKVENLKDDTLQGDRAIVNIIEAMNGLIESKKNSVEVKGVDDHLEALESDLRDNPDLVPVCVVLASLAQGKSKISGAKRLRFKESDRIDALSSELKKMGAEIKVLDDSLEIIGRRKLRGAEMNSHGDHRIAMACCVAALAAEGRSIIHGIECISKSYPNFINDIRSLGGKVIEQ